MKSVVEPSIDLKEFGDVQIKILDLGCKRCEWAEAQGLTKHFYVGIDFDKNALQANKGKGMFIFSDLEGAKLPFKGERFDLVVAKAVLEHVHNYQKLLSEINSVLKEGGIVYVGVPSERSYYIHDDYTHTGKAWTVKALTIMLEDFGFEVLEVFRVASEMSLLTIYPQKFIYALFHRTLRKFGLDFVTGSYVAVGRKAPYGKRA